MGDRVDLLIPLNQDAMDRHLGLLSGGAACIYNELPALHEPERVLNAGPLVHADMRNAARSGPRFR